MHRPQDPPAAAPALSRRTLAKAAVGFAVVGFHAGSGQWVSAAGRSSGDPFERVPRLDGTLLLDDASRTAFGQDFGQIVFDRPAAVLQPGSIEDIARMLRFARRHGIRVATRSAAHTTFGQSQHAAGITLDLTSLATIGPVGDGTVTVDAGCRWNAVLDATLATGQMPPVIPDYIGQTVGGTLAVGGIGAMSFHAGAQVDHVESLRAVTGEGRIVECSDHRHRDLFEALLAGQGQVGVIVQATLRLVPAPATVRLYDLIYPDLPTLLADLTLLTDDRRFDQMEAFAFPTGPGRWVYLLEAIAFHSAAGAPDDAAMLTGLGDSRPFLQTADLDFLAWSSRVPINQPTQPHPWIDLFVPMSAAQAFLEEVQRTIAPIGPGDRYNLLLIPLRASTFTRPLFRTHEGELGFGFDTLRSVPAGSDLAPLLAFNRQLYDLAKDLGGSQYPISAVELDEHDWAVHYGEQWERLRRAKRRYDGADVLASGPDVLGRC